MKQAERSYQRERWCCAHLGLVHWEVWPGTQQVRFPLDLVWVGAATDRTDIILVRMVADPTKPVERQHGYRNALQGVYKMVAQEGPASLARGLMPNTVCLSPASICFGAVADGMYDRSGRS